MSKTEFNIAPQCMNVEQLLNAAIAVLPSLPDGPEKEALCKGVERFEGCVAVTTWDMDDVRSQAGQLREPVELTDAEARMVLGDLLECYACSDAEWSRLEYSIEKTVAARADYPDAEARA